MRYVLPVLFHLLPIVPFAYGRVYGGIAALVLVALPYIKVRKLEGQLAHLEGLAQEPSHPLLDLELRSLRGAIPRWRALTFLR